MKLQHTKTITINLDLERERLRNGLKGAQLARHLELVDVFEAEDFKEFWRLYDALPYDEDLEYPEQELVGDYSAYSLAGFDYTSPSGVICESARHITRIN